MTRCYLYDEMMDPSHPDAFGVPGISPAPV